MVKRPTRSSETIVEADDTVKLSESSKMPTTGGHAKRPLRFDVHSFFSSSGASRTTLECEPAQTVFRQGDPADAIFYIRTGEIQLSVVSPGGKEGVIAVLSAGDFFGEGCLAGQRFHMASAITMVAATIVKVDVKTMTRLLAEQPALSQIFMKFLLSRNIQFEADLTDQLFNSSERRLARALLLRTDLGKGCGVDAVIPKINHEILAARVGTTRSRVNYFMNKFRRLGFIDYTGERGAGMRVHASLLKALEAPDTSDLSVWARAKTTPSLTSAGQCEMMPCL